MLKFLTYINAWFLSILLLVAPIIKTDKYITNNTDSSTYHYCYNHCCHQHCESIINFNYILFNFTHVLQDFINVLLNNSYTNSPQINNSKGTTNSLKKISKYKLKDLPIYTERIVIPSPLKDTINYVNDTITFNNVLSKSVTSDKDQKKQIRYTWKRRTLCTVSDNEKYSIGKLFEGNNAPNGPNDRKFGAKKTLLDYDESIFVQNVDPDSLRAHVRVKRDKSESDVAAPLKFQQDYVRDLANSFPQNNYDEINENSYDEYLSFDTKREIKPQEFFMNDEQSKASSNENNRHKILNVYPFTVPAYASDDTFVGNDFNKAPSDASKVNTFADNNVKCVDQVENQGKPLEESKNDITINQWSQENSKVQNLPEYPMLPIELVRKKRNNYAKAHNKKNLEKRSSSGTKNLFDSKEKTHDKEKRSVLESHKSESNLNPSSFVAANLKAHLLRIRRKTKGNKRHEKNLKFKKEKKHAGKKHNNSQQSVKDVRSKNTDRSKVSRKRKVHEAKTEGKSKVGIASIVSKENNDNNFRRRSIKLKKSIKGTDTEIDDPSRNDEPIFHEKLEKIGENKIEDDNSKFSLIVEKKSPKIENDANEVKMGSDRDASVFLTQDNEQGAFAKNEQPMPLNEIRLRTKRDKNTESHHGFLNKEEELRYYENIREPGSEMDLYDNQDETQSLVGNVAESDRAVRSIEEVKQLAQKLVTKVNELQNYLDIEKSAGSKKREKHVETRAIDDLCANVSTGCDTFKEAPKIAQKCVQTSNNKFGSRANIVERNVDSNKVTDKRKFGKIANKKSTERKRSVVRRVAKTPSNTSKGIPRQTQSRRKWGKWTDWSSCSVTCGKGRQIRWRYCLRDCTTAETEMEEKACQLPACPPGKFLGIF